MALTRDTLDKLVAIRVRMEAALKCKDITEYRRLGELHRQLLHEASPAIRTAWETCRAR